MTFEKWCNYQQVAAQETQGPLEATWYGDSHRHYTGDSKIVPDGLRLMMKAIERVPVKRERLEDHWGRAIAAH
jgi:hypothetical protein